MRHVCLGRSVLLVVGGLSAAVVLAQSVGQEMVITGQTQPRAEPGAVAEQLSGAALHERAQGSLGETLDRLPGVSSSYFGPQASRPVVRGLDGERVPVLSNGGASHDVSALSPDHAVAAEPMLAEGVQWLRGPAALLYGPGAIGGVVNVIDHRIPRERIERLQGRVQLQAATGAREGAAAAVLEGGDGQRAWHVDAFERRSGDVRAPNAWGRLPNSDSHTRGGAVGLAHVGEGARLGLSLSSWQSDYGTVADDSTRIGMRSDKLALEGQWRLPGAFWQSLEWQANSSAYSHTEFEEGLASTVFSRRAQDLRVQARHQTLGGWQGVLGWQAGHGRLQAVGEEAYVPNSSTRSQALFALETLTTAWGQWQLGARSEQVQRRSLGGTGASEFVTGERRFAPTSAAAAVRWGLAPGWQASAELAHSERAPSEAELFANGPHVATHAWELGQDRLGLERARGWALGVQRNERLHPIKFSLFGQRYAQFIGLVPTGQTREGWTEFRYQGVRAHVRGGEASGQSRLWSGAGALDLHWRADRVLADNLETGEPLPRMAPWRVGLSAVYRQDAWQWRLGVDHAGAQRRVPAGQQPTDSYNLWHAGLNYRQAHGADTLLWFARIDNLGNALAYSATSILTSTAPGRVPLPGRSLKAGVQWLF